MYYSISRRGGGREGGLHIYGLIIAGAPMLKVKFASGILQA